MPFQITPGQKMTKVTSDDHVASLISPTTEAEGAWKLVKKLTFFSNQFFMPLANLLAKLHI